MSPTIFKRDVLIKIASTASLPGWRLSEFCSERDTVTLIGCGNGVLKARLRVRCGYSTGEYGEANIIARCVKRLREAHLANCTSTTSAAQATAIECRPNSVAITSVASDVPQEEASTRVLDSDSHLCRLLIHRTWV